MNANDFYYFKGDRDYIQAGNIFDYILSQKEYIPKNIDFRLSHLTQNQWCLKSNKEKVANMKILGQYKDDSSFLYIIESGNNITKRIRYDEKKMIQKFELCDKKIKVENGIYDFTFIEKINAAFKFLLTQSIFPNDNIRYIFVRLVIDYIPKDGFELRYNRKIGCGFCEGKIIESEIDIGFIYFFMENIL